MALIGAVYKWRLDCDSYIYITDTEGLEPLIIVNDCIDEAAIKDIVATWDAETYCERFKYMVDFVHSHEKWKDLRFLDCNVYLKEYYGCDEMLRPAFPTGIQLNLSATSVDYKEEADAVVTDVKCITRDGEKITSYDINFEIPKGIPGLTIKGSWTPAMMFSTPILGEINDGYIIDRDATLNELPQGAKKGDLWVCTQNSDIINGKQAVYEFTNVNLCGPAGEGNYRFNETKQSYMFGEGDTASGLYSITKGLRTTASGDRSTAEGYETQATGLSSHAEGQSTVASSTGSHSEGRNTTASGNASHAEGNGSTASGTHAHAEGFNTVASGNYSHSEGVNTQALGNYSHAEGYGNIAPNNGQHVGGTYATIDDTGSYLFQIGVGTDPDNRQDAFIIKDDGTVIIYTLES